MKLSKKQSKDLETVKYFIPDSMKDVEISERDVEQFFEHSDKGMHKSRATSFESRSDMDGFSALLWGKKYRGMHMGMYEEGVLDGSVPYFVLLEGMPESVMEFAAKEMFRGHSETNIREVWNAVNSDNSANAKIGAWRMFKELFSKAVRFFRSTLLKQA